MEKGEKAEAPRAIPNPPGVHPIYEIYPCKKREVGEKDLNPHPCKQISISVSEVQKQPQKKEETEKEKKEAPQPMSKKRFEEFKRTKTCSLPYSRNWTQGEIEKRRSNELPKWFLRRREPVARRMTCPRQLHDYEKKLWIPICEKEKEEKKECKVPIDGNACVFCLSNLYLHGYIQDLFEKVPKVKKQSDIYGDDIAERIGIRTRITVHKKCYDNYIDRINHKTDYGEEQQEAEDEDMTCEVEEKAEEKEEENDEDEIERGKDKNKNKDKEGKRQNKAHDLSKLPKKPYFCLKKFQIPKIESGECSSRRFRGRGIDRVLTLNHLD